MTPFLSKNGRRFISRNMRNKLINFHSQPYVGDQILHRREDHKRIITKCESPNFEKKTISLK